MASPPMTLPDLLILSPVAPDPSPPIGEWAEVVVEGQHAGYELKFSGGMISLMRQPDHMNRGDYLADVDLHNRNVVKSSHDLWPRYLFGLEAAKAHCEEWLRRHGVTLTPSQTCAVDQTEDL
ncbi:MAG: hypothetical protein AAGI68_16710 [Planctomycetota bacterium]